MKKQNKVKRMRYSDHELSLIKNTFADQEELLVLFRKFLLQGSMADDELAYINGYVSQPTILTILRKALVPTIDKSAGPFQTVDLLSSIDLSQVPNEHANLIIKARQMAIEFLRQRFDILAGGEPLQKDEIMFDALTDFEEDPELAHIKLLTRNFLLSHIDTQLFNSIMIMAGTKDEDPDAQKRRLQQDSSQ